MHRGRTTREPLMEVVVLTGSKVPPTLADIEFSGEPQEAFALAEVRLEPFLDLAQESAGALALAATKASELEIREKLRWVLRHLRKCANQVGLGLEDQ